MNSPHPGFSFFLRKSTKRQFLYSIIFSAIAVTFFTGCATDPYVIALQDGDFDAVRAEVETDPESAHKTAEQDLYPLHVAANNNQGEIIRYLVEKGADPNQRNSSGRTALFSLGSNKERFWFREYYKEHLHRKLPDEGKMSSKESMAVTLEAVRAVLQKAREAKISKDEIGSAAIALIHAGADPNLTDNSGHNALWYIMPKHYPVTFQIILEAGTEDLEPIYDVILDDLERLTSEEYKRRDLTWYEKSLVDNVYFTSRFVHNYIHFSRLVCGILIEDYLKRQR